MTSGSPSSSPAGGMRPRDPHEPGRAATPLELFFDLVFVVAIAIAAADLHHGVLENHAFEALHGYLLAFFGIWWAWMNFTWFASAYDCDDARYRLLVFVQMTGALVFASGVSALAAGDFTIAISGYVIMRLALVVQWLRAAAADPARRTTALRYAVGVALLQVGWVGLLFAPSSVGTPLLAALIAAELAVPAWAESAGATPWHPHHIAERYGLLTIIVLGESVLAATTAMGAIVGTSEVWSLMPTVVGGLLLLYAMWWLYFERPVHDLIVSTRQAFVWGYAHYFVYAAAAAVGAGLAIMIDVATHDPIPGLAPAWSVAIPVAVYIGMLWLVCDRGHGLSFARAPGPVAAGLTLLTPWSPEPILTAGVVLVLYVAWRGRARST